MKIVDGSFVGSADLQDIAEKLGHKTVADLVLDRCVFAPLSIVAATKGRPIVNSVRQGSFTDHEVVKRHSHIGPEIAKRLWGIQCTDDSAPGVYVDDNSSADFAFSACFTVRREQQWTKRSATFSRICRSTLATSQVSLTSSWFPFGCPSSLITMQWCAKRCDGSSA